MNKFYFVSYDREVGSAGNMDELISELERLSREDPMCVEYHLENGHIVEWLVYIGENEKAGKLKGVKRSSDAVKILKGVKAKKPSAGKKSSLTKTKGANRKTVAHKEDSSKDLSK